MKDYTITGFKLKDSSQAFRTVGFLEYGQALRRFELLVKTAPPKELTAYDELLQSRQEFTVYTNLSRRIEPNSTTLQERPRDQNDDFARRGLGWMMALARVELAAILTTFTDAPQPFVALFGTEFDLPQYKELLYDGMRTHYWALANDPGLKLVAAAKKFDVSLLSYIRRLILVQSFLHAAAELNATEYTPLQREELKAWNENISKVQAMLAAKVQMFIAMQEANKEYQRELSECGAACKRLTSSTGPTTPAK